MFTCPKGCQSFDADYCSECGARITGASIAPPIAAEASRLPPPTQPLNIGGALTHCPDCAAERIPPDAVFCELCRYNFTTGQACNAPLDAVLAPEPAPVAESAPEAPPQAEAVEAGPSVLPDAVVGPIQLEVRVSADAKRFAEAPHAVPDEAFPPERVFSLDLSELLIGRRSDKKDIHPEIPLNEDAAVSHRHAKLLRLPDGGFAVLDLGSANGTSLNEVDLQPGVRTPVKPGDAIQLGRFSVLTICETKG